MTALSGKKEIEREQELQTRANRNVNDLRR